MVTDPIPPGLTFVPGSIEYSTGGPSSILGTKTDAAGDDEAEYFEELANIADDWLPLIDAHLRQLVGHLEELSEGAPELVELLESLTDEGDDEDDDYILE